MVGDARRGEARAGGETHYRPEAVGRCGTGEVKSWHARFELPRDDGCLLKRGDRLLEFGVEESELRNVRTIAGGSDQVISVERAFAALAVNQGEPHPVTHHYSADRRVTRKHQHRRDTACHDPASGRAKLFTAPLPPPLRGHAMHDR